MHWTDELRAAGACEEAIAWFRKFDDPLEAWAKCPDAEWLDWWSVRVHNKSPRCMPANRYGAYGLMPLGEMDWTADEFREWYPEPVI